MSDRSTLERQLLLAAALRRMGDSRYGGTLPIGGKPYAGIRRDEGPGMMEPFKRGASSKAYDHIANLHEQELEDLARREGGVSPERLQGGFGAYY